ncbi:ribosome maturation factor RimM [Neisseriaceae bacterium ESL0693]|nr:ribosome maturation factor RimM [Neisseriaceae bacterium ESL0693]
MSTTQPQWVGMGYIKGVFGVKGWVKVHTSTEYTDGLLDYPQWRLCKDKDVQTVTVAESKINGNELLVRFAGIDDRDQAALLRGYTIEIDRAEFAKAEDNEYYWTDLIGLDVVNQQQINLGTVSSLMESGAHDILVVDGTFGRKLIPFVAAFIHEISLDQKQILVDWDSDY